MVQKWLAMIVGCLLLLSGSLVYADAPAEGRAVMGVSLTADMAGFQVEPERVRYWLEEGPADREQLLAREDLWQPIEGNSIHFGSAVEQNIWLRFDVHNPGAEAGRWLLTIPWSLLNRLDVSVHHADGSWGKTYRGGYDIPYTERFGQHRTFLFPLDIAAGEQATVLIRAHAKYIAFIPLLLWTPDQFSTYDFYDNIIYGVALGILLAMVVYNLILGVFLRDTAYLFYSTFVLSVILYQFAVTGYGSRYIWQDVMEFQGRAFSLFASISFMFAGLFLRNFLRLRKRGGWVLHLNTIIVGYWLLSIPVTLMDPMLLRKVGDPMALVTCIAGLTTTIHLWRKGDVSARYFTIAWTFVIAATFVIVLMFRGVIPYDPMTAKTQLAGFVAECMLLAFALVERINRERRQREILQQTTLEMIQQASAERQAKLEAQAEALKLQQRHNEELEQRVRDRTAELERALTELEQANHELATLSMTDALTGLHNRRYFDEVLRNEIARSQRLQLPVSLILVDVDYFKRINDTWGHLIGDECLRLVAAALSQVVVRSTDLVARYGGEEFAIILPGTSEADALKVAERVRQTVEKISFIHQGERIILHVSLGVAGWIPLPHETNEQLVAAADSALYRAKQRGRNRVELARA